MTSMRRVKNLKHLTHLTHNLFLNTSVYQMIQMIHIEV